MFLEEKKKAIETVFEKVRENLVSLKAPKRKEHIKRLVEKAKKEIDVKYVYCNKTDKKPMGAIKTQEAEILGGIIAENKKKDVRVDYSYETLLEDIKEKYLQDLGNKLFD